MSARRWLVVVVLGAFALVVAIWATRPWSDTQALATPRGVTPASVTYECGAPWGSGSVKGPETTPYPVVGKPCDHRQERRRLAALDIGAVAVAILVVSRWGSFTARRHHETGALA